MATTINPFDEQNSNNGVQQNAVPTSAATTGSASLITGTTTPTQAYQPAQDANSVVQGFTNSLLDGNGQYIQNARRRGIESASGRGLLNSSISAGNSQRAAIEAAQPFVQQMVGIHQNREQAAFTGEQNALDRVQQTSLQREGFTFQEQQQQRDQTYQAAQNKAQRDLTAQLQREGFSFQEAQQQAALQFEATQSQAQRDLTAQLQREGYSLQQAQLAAQQQFAAQQNQLDRDQQLTMSQVQDWLNNQTFQREFNGALSMLPITSATKLLDTIQNYALENPEVYTPDVINGMSNFFSSNLTTMLKDYFPQYYNQGGG